MERSPAGLTHSAGREAGPHRVGRVPRRPGPVAPGRSAGWNPTLRAGVARNRLRFCLLPLYNGDLSCRGVAWGDGQEGLNNLRQLLSQQQLEQGVQDLARRIGESHGENPLTIVGVLTGSIVLLADLIRQLEMPLRVGVVQASSYEGAKRGQLTINSELMPNIRDRDVLLVDDILDSGRTLKEMTALTRQLAPRSVRSAVLLRKIGAQQVALDPDFVCFEIPDEFVVGYGLDYRDAYRNLPFLAALEQQDMTGTGP